MEVGSLARVLIMYAKGHEKKQDLEMQWTMPVVISMPPPPIRIRGVAFAISRIEEDEWIQSGRGIQAVN